MTHTTATTTPPPTKEETLARLEAERVARFDERVNELTAEIKKWAQACRDYGPARSAAVAAMRRCAEGIYDLSETADDNAGE